MNHYPVTVCFQACPPSADIPGRVHHCSAVQSGLFTVGTSAPVGKDTVGMCEAVIVGDVMVSLIRAAHYNSCFAQTGCKDVRGWGSFSPVPNCLSNCAKPPASSFKVEFQLTHTFCKKFLTPIKTHLLISWSNLLYYFNAEQMINSKSAKLNQWITT